MTRVSPLDILVCAGDLASRSHSLQNPHIRGMPFGGKQHKIDLFAVDVLLTLIEDSIPKAMEILKTYSKVSCFKINF